MYKKRHHLFSSLKPFSTVQLPTNPLIENSKHCNDQNSKCSACSAPALPSRTGFISFTRDAGRAFTRETFGSDAQIWSERRCRISNGICWFNLVCFDTKTWSEVRMVKFSPMQETNINLRNRNQTKYTADQYVAVNGGNGEENQTFPMSLNLILSLFIGGQNNGMSAMQFSGK